MITSTCTCGQLLFFENCFCVNCKRDVGFLPDAMIVSSLEPIPNDPIWYALDPKTPIRKKYKKCTNYSKNKVCNWMIAESDEPECFCVSCRLNLVIPDLTIPKNIEQWQLIEFAKQRFVYSALRLKLPLESRKVNPTQGLGFQFLADTLTKDGKIERVLTGHAQGLITLNIEEADDAAREKNRLALKEPYRTLLGHFRHETGHYYWDRLIANGPFIEPFRETFGDERKDYSGAMKAYYESGAKPGWENLYVSAYATMHPWEDWAETWAHFLHIHDSLEVARDFGFVGNRIKIDPKNESDPREKAKPFDEVLEGWSNLTVALNSINRSMGLRDLYPFVLSKTVIGKLHFIADVIAALP